MKDLSSKLENIIKNRKCNSDEKKMLNDTFQKFSKMIVEVSNNTYFKQLKLSHLNIGVLSKLNNIINNYESIFSWKIKQLIGRNQNLLLNVKDRIQEKLTNHSVENDEFNEYR